jgi:long-subunit fatty acid transport protein
MVQENRHAPRRRTISRNRTPLFAFLWCLSLSDVAYPVSTQIPISPEPVGSGARALGQSAFIAVADDATAASWNPAGLIQLEEPEASFVGAYKTVTSVPTSTDTDTSYDRDCWSRWQINFMSYAQPLRIGNTDAVLSVNYHQVYDLTSEFNYLRRLPDFNDSLAGRGRSEGAISAYSIAGALSLPFYPRVSFGTSFNWYSPGLLNGHVWQVEGQYSWKNPPAFTITETYDHLEAYNFTFGILWDVQEKEENLLTLGFVCHTPFTAKVSQEVVNFDPSMDPPTAVDHGRLDIDFPLSLGAGVNYRFSDHFSTALDLQWTNWSQYTYTEAPPSSYDDAWAIRWGFERLWFSPPAGKSVYALRGGLFYEPRPAWGDILPVYGFSVGLGWTVQHRFSLDIAYQFRWGAHEYPASADPLDFNSGFNYYLQEQLVVASLIVYL